MMARQFCTLFDANYLTRALALYKSLEATHPSFLLHMFCMDEQSSQLLEQLALPRARIVPIAALETSDPELAAVRETRNPVEYCWTATPAVCLYCLERYEALHEITYLDADLFFFADSTPLFDELAEASVLITEHRFAEEFAEWEADGGIYNVQFMTFRRTPAGIEALRWWRERCLDWCYDRHEPGRFGDQRYLDDWPTRFNGVHVLQHRGILAPWNSGGAQLAVTPSGVTVDGVELVFYHCHALEVYLDRKGVSLCALASALARLRIGGSSYGLVSHPVRMGWRTYPPYRVSGSGADPRENALIWMAYAQLLSDALLMVRTVEPTFSAGSRPMQTGEFVFWQLRDLAPGWLRPVLGGVRRRIGIEV